MVSIPVLVLFAVASGVGAYFGAYFRKKGSNLATKEDIGKITREVEAVRAAFTRDIEDRKAAQALRTACLDRRLQAHQEAYTLWLGLFRSVHGTGLGNHVTKCQQWWDENCLYLDQGARQAFLTAFRMAHIHPSIRDSHDVDGIKQNWADIMKAGPEIEKGVGLPPTTGELEPL